MTLWNKLSFFLVAVVVVVTTLAYGAVHQPIIVLFYAMVTLMLIFWAADGFASGSFRFSRNKLQIPLLLLSAVHLAEVYQQLS